MGSIEKVLLEVAPNDPQFKDPKVDCTLAFCWTLVLVIRPNGFQKSVVYMHLYGGECHNPFNAKIS